MVSLCGKELRKVMWEVSEENIWFLNEGKGILTVGLALQEVTYCTSFSLYNDPFSLQQMLLAWNGQDSETHRQRAGAGKICWLTCSLCTLPGSPFWIPHQRCLIIFEALISLVNLNPFWPVTTFKDSTSELNLARKSQRIIFFFWWKVINALYLLHKIKGFLREFYFFWK